MTQHEKEPKDDDAIGPIRRGKFSIQNRYFDFHGPVFWTSSIVALAFIAVTLALGSQMENIFSTIQDGVSTYTGWFFIIAVNLFLLFCIYLAFSRFGGIRIGGEKATPEFSNFAWFSMLFSAGMGIGLLFWGVGEPITHFINNPFSQGQDAEAAQTAMQITFLHYGLHAWSIYAVVGLAIAFFAFNKKLPLSIRSIFHPLLGSKIHGWMGDLIDVLAVVSTLFGLATTLGLGVQQIAAGLNHLFDIPDTTISQVILIGIITMAATVSVILGLDKGVRVLSEFNIRLAAVLLVVVVLAGPTLFIFDSFVQNTGNYAQNLVQLSLWTESYRTEGAWQNSWTVFYWAWWIAWSPFVGMFIARISKGRTVREFILGVLLVPTLLTFFWISAFGGTALFQELQMNSVVSEAVQENVATALFVMVESFPASFFINLLAIILVVSFFVTSSDSGSLVVDSLTSGGKLDAPVGQRIFWAQMEGLVAAVLLLGGGLTALQTASILAGLPFAVIVLIMCYSLYKGLQEEHESLQRTDEGRQREVYTELVRNVLKRRSESQATKAPADKSAANESAVGGGEEETATTNGQNSVQNDASTQSKTS
ncbi:MAG TPA: choline transporter [Bacteroidetes bacterium]|nr:MAG: BCCT family transporter [Rhodothermaeota bacterium MED-G64]RPF80376.1 MAG: BCCT family transporter [Rhodothermaceae bacterium TMED105]HBV99818.1 choline transporter [Bacteroidota bacterium]